MSKKRKSGKDKKKAVARNINKLVRERKYKHTKSEYPSLVVITDGDVPKEFVETVQAAVKKVDLRDPTMFSDDQQVYFRLQKKNGLAVARQEVGQWYRGHGSKDPVYAHMGEDGFLIHQFLLAPGRALYSAISTEDRRRFFPYCNLTSNCYRRGGRDFEIRLTSLCCQPTPRGTAYYSPYKPTIFIDGKPKVVAFYRHAIERIGERRFANRETYACLGDYHSIMRQCVYYEVVQLTQTDKHSANLAFSMYDLCTNPFASWLYVVNLIDPIDPRKKYQYRVGYFPVAIWNEFAIAKTLLYPGFTTTPEYGCLVNADIPEDERRVLIDRAKKESEVTLEENRDYSLLKFFHDHGVPQVVSLDFEVYRYS